MLTRRALPVAILASGLVSGRALADADLDLVQRAIGKRLTDSARVRLVMPEHFPNGYTVPLALDVDSPMTEREYVQLVSVFAPQNPIVLVARFQFSPASGRAHLATRIRLARPQTVFAVAELSDGSALLARIRVSVASNGCA